MSPLSKIVKGDIFIMGSIFKAAQDASKSPLFNFNPINITSKTSQYNQIGNLIKYNGGDALKLNAYLREGLEMPDDLFKLSVGIDKELNTLPIYKGDVYRTLGFSRNYDYQNFLNEWKQENIVSTKAYTSASKEELYSDPTTMKYGVLMKLNSITGRDMAGIGLNESEVVFPRGVKFKVQKTKIQNTNAGSILFIAADEV